MYYHHMFWKEQNRNKKETERFWKRTQFNDDGHWIFQGRKTSVMKYGNYSISGKVKHCHHVSWLLTGKFIPHGYILKNTCDREDCINPSHMQLHSYSDLMKNTQSKRIFGENHPRVKLTNRQVEDIMQSMDTQINLSKKYNVSQSLLFH